MPLWTVEFTNLTDQEREGAESFLDDANTLYREKLLEIQKSPDSHPDFAALNRVNLIKEARSLKDVLITEKQDDNLWKISFKDLTKLLLEGLHEHFAASISYNSTWALLCDPEEQAKRTEKLSTLFRAGNKMNIIKNKKADDEDLEVILNTMEVKTD